MKQEIIVNLRFSIIIAQEDEITTLIKSKKKHMHIIRRILDNCWALHRQHIIISTTSNPPQ